MVVATVEYDAQFGKRLVMAGSGGRVTGFPELGGGDR